MACGCCRRGSARTWAEVAYRADKATNQKVSDGTRTRDHLDHNQELYQLSYAHRAGIPIYQRVGAGTKTASR